MKYRQITSSERYAIAALRRQGHSLPVIARDLRRSPSTISREVRRNRCAGAGYRASKADSRTRGRRSRSRRNAHFTADDWVIVERCLRMDWSPEQVSGFLRVEGIMRISHETICLHVWADRRAGGDLWRHLRHADKRCRKRYGGRDWRRRLAGKRHISERPPEIESRKETGRWEIDTVKGDGQARHSAVTIVERATGFLQMGKPQRHRAVDTAECCIELIRRQPDAFLTITADNGTEFPDYRDIESATGVEFCFATPCHSWERGTNENTNGLIRQYLPKGRSMAHITQADLDAIAAKLNSRPRKRLGYKTPEECHAQS